MKVKEFLTNDPFVNLKHVAREMWPNNKASDTYISKKLNGALPWTEKDEAKAKKVLKRLSEQISNL